MIRGGEPGSYDEERCSLKKQYVADIKRLSATGISLTFLGWIRGRRVQGGLLFLDLCDSTGSIQAVVDRANVSPATYEIAKRVPVESAIRVHGKLAGGEPPNPRTVEIHAISIQVIGSATREISPHPRGHIDILDSTLQEHLLSKRHLYLRNDKVIAILRFRHLLLRAVRHWFESKGFIEVTAPILTPTPLYDDRSAISLNVQGERVYLTQCVGFYLESAVHALEKVYNIGPSFRGEESRSRRHLMEYWHIKAEVAFGGFEDIIELVEGLIRDVTRYCIEECGELAEIVGTEICADGMATPYRRIRYSDAISLLQSRGMSPVFGTSLSASEEELLSEGVDRPVWLTGVPRSIEPFPYVIDPDDARVTRTADLIATRGCGELLGVAEKIADLRMLDERMREKGKAGDERYEWLREMREYGCVPHIGFGLGVERLIRWLIGLPHVRDAIPFPRIFRRKIEP